MVAAVVNETYIPYPQVVDGRCLRLSSGLRGIGLCPFYPVAVLLLLLGGCGCIGNGSSRNGPYDGADGRTPVSSSPASVTVTYQPADGTAYIASDGSSCKHSVRVACSHLACAASAEDDGCCQDSYKRLFHVHIL